MEQVEATEEEVKTEEYEPEKFHEEEIVEEKSQQEENVTVEEKPAAKADDIPNIVVKIKGETWLEIKDENEVYVSKIVNAGFEYVIPNKKGIIFSVGRYYNADVYINGKKVDVATKHKQTNIRLDKFLN